MIDMVSGAEVREAEILVTPAMIEAGRNAARRLCSGADNYLSREACNIYRAMERARRRFELKQGESK